MNTVNLPRFVAMYIWKYQVLYVFDCTFSPRKEMNVIERAALLFQKSRRSLKDVALFVEVLVDSKSSNN